MQSSILLNLKVRSAFETSIAVSSRKFNRCAQKLCSIPLLSPYFMEVKEIPAGAHA
jgi:hypothetical protein